jgi:hypothetical protein
MSTAYVRLALGSCLVCFLASGSSAEDAPSSNLENALKDAKASEKLVFVYAFDSV